MKKTALLVTIIFLIFISAALSYDLSSIEDIFIDYGEITCYIVVAENGSSSDVLAQLEVLNYLNGLVDTPATGIYKLVSEIDDPYEKDIITIGNPCVNNITKEIMDYEGDCVFEKGLMKLYEKENKNQLVIYGAGEKSTRDAVKSITEGEIEGEEVEVEPTLEEKLEIQKQKQIEELLKKTQQEEEQLEEEPEEELEEEPEEEREVVVVEAEKEPEVKKTFWQRIIDFFKNIFK